jgi:hypothetical protein
VEAVKQIINSDVLDGVVSLPRAFLNQRVEITVALVEEKSELPPLTKGGIDAMLKDSITESLIGVLPRSGLSLEDYRTERLGKYERAN